MADLRAAPLLRRDPLDGVPAITARSRLAIEAAPRGARLVLRGSESAAIAAGQAFGLALPLAINTAATDDVRTAFRLGPDEWLLLAPQDQEKQVYDAIEAAVAEPHSLVDASHRNVGILVSGSLAADVLANGVMLDLDPAAFPPGMATRTLYVKAEIVLWRKGAQDFHIEVWRSFAAYMHGLLEEAAREYVK
ncbi:sarcosine oxidase subunit gamma [Labrys monachus]|uniref:Sarcosine oxidase subunit gamma n=1 Tax=Labrys monachus TaxID=217067 RepID=A0ABU0FNA2_9HYPH|nr:sarcosine oxidase subunit gamma family protein [Labrys monachus]MDQ0396101.1 sarcosine oxidase subunit gamma [Labrys monachus]